MAALLFTIFIAASGDDSLTLPIFTFMRFVVTQSRRASQVIDLDAHLPQFSSREPDRPDECI